MVSTGRVCVDGIECEFFASVAPVSKESEYKSIGEVSIPLLTPFEFQIAC
jgi:hypothetical protein